MKGVVKTGPVECSGVVEIRVSREKKSRVDVSGGGGAVKHGKRNEKRMTHDSGLRSERSTTCTRKSGRKEKEIQFYCVRWPRYFAV